MSAGHRYIECPCGARYCDRIDPADAGRTKLFVCADCGFQQRYKVPVSPTGDNELPPEPAMTNAERRLLPGSREIERWAPYSRTQTIERT